ncbi:Glycosyltransferase involved in cell wall bisynthesis [Mucilaginibacter sp. OK268]|jgi:glycosyltransferase involved in cell wall biosynthesis|uniref:glycosyltransferase n=1 Tax=Mucilaginibacter sp. OK268 TaxID=1881048 RepID=UPI000884C6EB|nr:glycosyltransferase [Mucilaginibacter sp. OK268]SDQ00086.1 Glycosyltransferase involved in cell wall bisynthesis [Mucilaginibacter sp. OK268]
MESVIKKNIIVNAVSLKNGGARTILLQFFNQLILKQNDFRDFDFYLFICDGVELDARDIPISLQIVHLPVNNIVERVNWEVFGLRKWIKEKDLNVSLFVSLQSIGFFFNDKNQLIYYHNPIPVYPKRWNIWKKNETKLWIYKTIFKKIMRWSYNDNSVFIAQVKWVEQALKDTFYINGDQIHIIKPDISSFQNRIHFLNDNGAHQSDPNYIYFPATEYPYKNHLFIVNILSRLLQTAPNEEPLLSTWKIIFTLDVNTSSIYQIIKQRGLEKYFLFTGHVSYNEAMKYYQKSKLILFPSYIETFGLPLIEAAFFGKKILASDLSFVSEVLPDYDGLQMIPLTDEDAWVKALLDNINHAASFDSYLPNYETGWDDFFGLIKRYS